MANKRDALLPPFPYFGGKRKVVEDVWRRLGNPKQYIEPFCGSAVMLLGAPRPASLEVIGDINGFIANFWRAVKHQPDAVAEWADYPVSHIDLGARHAWLMSQRDRLGAELQDAEWSGDAQVAGWWLWGQCAWIGSGWCEWDRKIPHVSNAGRGVQAIGQVPHVSNAGRGVQAIGQVPHVSNAGMGVQAIGRIPHVSNAGMGVQAIGQIPHVGNAGMGVQEMLTSGGRTALRWLRRLAERLDRVRVIHGSWDRCLNTHYGTSGGDKSRVAIFLDPPYLGYSELYGRETNVASDVAAWARTNGEFRIALCGHVGEHDMPGWSVLLWSRARSTYGSTKTRDAECIYFSPTCVDVAASADAPTLALEMASA